MCPKLGKLRSEEVEDRPVLSSKVSASGVEGSGVHKANCPENVKDGECFPAKLSKFEPALSKA